MNTKQLKNPAKTSVYVPRDLYERIAAIAAAEDRSIVSIIRRAVEALEKMNQSRVV